MPVVPACTTAAVTACTEASRGSRYLDDHEAVLLGYKNVRIVTKQVCLLTWECSRCLRTFDVDVGADLLDMQALLTPWLPYLTIEAQAKLLWLKPVPGKILGGYTWTSALAMIIRRHTLSSDTARS